MLNTDFTTGSPNWLDLGSPDTVASAAFYGAVFGWDIRPTGPEADYGYFQKDGSTVAGLGLLTEAGASSAWTVYFQTPDADATAKAVEQAGGTVRVEPTDVLDEGRMAHFTDPGGADFAVWQPAAGKGLEQASKPDTLCWVELHTPDRTAAHAFYRSLFGWRKEDMEVPGMTYGLLATADGDQQDATFGGLVQIRSAEETPRWMPYFGVEDADATVARAQESGGSVLMPASDVPDVGRIAWLADAFGAPFAVIKPMPPA